EVERASQVVVRMLRVLLGRERPKPAHYRQRATTEVIAHDSDERQQPRVGWVLRSSRVKPEHPLEPAHRRRSKFSVMSAQLEIYRFPTVREPQHALFALRLRKAVTIVAAHLVAFPRAQRF